jgi:hypothetical protein
MPPKPLPPKLDSTMLMMESSGCKTSNSHKPSQVSTSLSTDRTGPTHGMKEYQLQALLT